MMTVLALSFIVSLILKPCVYRILVFSIIAINKYLAAIVISEDRVDNNRKTGNPQFYVYGIVPRDAQRNDTTIDDDNNLYDNWSLDRVANR
jgi:hypothetical protein